MNEIKQVKSSIKKEIQFILQWGIVIGILLSILDSLVLLGFYRYVYLHMAAKWPVGILTGILLATMVVFFRRTTVLVTGDSIAIRSIGRKVQCSIKDFDMPIIRRKEHHYEVVKRTSTKIYLRFRDSVSTKIYGLFAFSEVELEQLMQFIREQHSKNMPVEEKLAVLDSWNNIQETVSSYENVYEDGEASEDEIAPNICFRSPEEIIRRERKTIFKIGGIWLIVLAAMLVFLFCGFSDSSMDNVKIIFFIFLLCIMLAAVPVQLLILSWKSKRCPETIRIEGNAMRIGQKYFSYSGVAYISMTSPRKSSDSIFPVQYWMHIKANGERHKYWLGSQASYGEYTEFCKTLEQVLVMWPEKLKYRGRS